MEKIKSIIQEMNDDLFIKPNLEISLGEILEHLKFLLINSI